MRYLESRFSVAMPGTSEYASNWERTFGKRVESLDSAGESACAPTAEGGVCAANHAEGLEEGEVGGCVAMAPGGGAGYQKPPPSSETDGGVSGFHGVES